MNFFTIQGKILTPPLVNPSRLIYIKKDRIKKDRTPPSSLFKRASAAIALLIVLALISFWHCRSAEAADGLVEPPPPGEKGQPGPTLTEAVMCEALSGYTPENPAVVFSVARQRVFCFTAFDPVPEKTVVYHKWYRRDVFTATVKLQLNPPRWVTFSNMQLRESDKGPWQVKITNADGRVFRILRYSITD